MTSKLMAVGVSKSFGGLSALKDCTLELREGSLTGLIGPNGSGKTTLFNVVTGYERPDAGEVFLGGLRITRASPERVFRLGVGRTFQLTRIFTRMSVLDNMFVASQGGERLWRYLGRRAGSRRERARAEALLDFVGIGHLAGQPAGNLSYGQRKLLELAFVLMADPAVVLLDEPAGGVNPSLVNHIGERIRALNAEGRTFLVVEHNMEFVMGLCDEVTVMQFGRPIVTGTPSAVRSDPRVLEAYLGGLEDEGEKDHGPVGL